MNTLAKISLIANLIATAIASVFLVLLTLWLAKDAISFVRTKKSQAKSALGFGPADVAEMT